MNYAEFPYSVIEKIGYYVYLLIDPENNNVFYVGKGYGNRIFHHINDALSIPRETDKLNKIREIHSKGLQVMHEVLRHGLTEKEAFEVEAALIDFVGLPELTNVLQGAHTNYRGRMGVADIIAIYRAEEVVIKEPVLLITINKLFEHNLTSERLYEITRGNWVLGEKRNKAQYAFAVYNGIVREVYQILRWFPDIARSKNQKTRNRWRYEGKISQELQHYVGVSVTSYIKLGAQNPVKYVNC